MTANDRLLRNADAGMAPRRDIRLRWDFSAIPRYSSRRVGDAQMTMELFDVTYADLDFHFARDGRLRRQFAALPDGAQRHSDRRGDLHHGSTHFRRARALADRSSARRHACGL